MRRILATVVLVAAAACADPDSAAEPGPTASSPAPPTESEPGIVVSLAAGDRRPTGGLTFGSTVQDGSLGSYCWTSTGAAVCVDVGPDVFVPESYVEVAPGTEIAVEGDVHGTTGRLAEVVEEFTFHLLTRQELDLSDGTDVLTLEPGDYTLELVGTWDQGQVPFYFGIRIV